MLTSFIASRQSCKGSYYCWVADGTRLFALDENRGTLERETCLPPEHGAALSICCVPRSEGTDSIWVGFTSGAIIAIDGGSLRVVSETVLHEGSVTGLVWVAGASPTNDDVVVSIASDGRAALWSALTQECITCALVSHASLTSIAILSCSPGQLQVAIGTASGNLHSLSPFQQEEAMLVPGAHVGSVRQIEVMPCADSDATRIWSVGSDGSLCSWEGSRHRVGAYRSFFRVLSKSPTVQLDGVAGKQILSLESLMPSQRQIRCLLGEGDAFATIDATSGAVLTTWATVKPLGDPVICATTFCKAFSVHDRCFCDVPIKQPPPPIPPFNESHERHLKETRMENQRLREQIQVLLRSPLQRSSEPSGDLLQMKQCYASALSVLNDMEHATREFMVNLESQIRSDANSWMAYAQRGAHNTESARRMHDVVQSLHSEQEEVSRLSHELTELRLRFSTAQQCEDVAKMEAAAAKRQAEQDRESLVLLERKMTARDSEVLDLTRQAKLHTTMEKELREELNKVEALLRVATEHADSTASGLQLSLEQERNATATLQRELANCNEVIQAMREKTAAAVASESSTLQRVAALEAQMETRLAEKTECILKEHVDRISKLQEEISQRKLKEDSLQQLVSALREESSLQAQEIVARREKLKRQQRATSETSSAMIDALQAEVHELRRQNSDLANAKHALDSERELLLDQIQSQRYAVKDELSRMEAQVLNLQRHAEDESVGAEVAIARRKICSLETELEVANNEMDNMQVLFHKQRVALEDKILHQAAELEAAIERGAELQRRVNQSEKKHRELELTLQESARTQQEEVHRLHSQLDAQRSLAERQKSDELESQQRVEAVALQQRQQLAALKDQLCSQQSEFEETIRQLKVAHRSEHLEQGRLIEELKDDLDRKHREVERMCRLNDATEARAREEAAAACQPLEHVITQTRHTIATLEATLKSKEAEIVCLQQKLDDEQAKSSAALRHARTSHEEALAAVDEKLHKCQRELKQQAADHIQVLSAVETSKAEAKQSAQQMLNGMRCRLEAEETMRIEAEERARTYQRELAAALDKVANFDLTLERRLVDERRLADEEINKAVKSAGLERSDAQDAKKELERALKTCRTLSNEKVLHETEAEDLRVQLLHASERLRTAVRDADVLKRQVEDLQHDVEDKEELRKQRDAAGALQVQQAAEIQRLTRVLKSLEMEKATQHEQLTELRDVNTVLRQVLDDEKELARERDAEILRCKQSYDVLCSSNAHQQQELAHIQEQHRIVVANLHAYELAHRDRDASRRWQPTPDVNVSLSDKSPRQSSVRDNSVVGQWVKAATSSRSPSVQASSGQRKYAPPVNLQQLR